MVNYLSPLAMYPGKSAHYGGGGWYGWPQQQLQEDWPAHPFHQADWAPAPHAPAPAPDYEPPAHAHFPKRELAASPPGTASSELSSPDAGAGSPCHARPPLPRSPYEWMKKPNYQNQPNPGKTRTKDKYRVVYSDHQRLELEKEFHYSRYITIRRKAELAASLGLSERQVKIWFQNRRAKERKQVKKREEVVLKDKGDHASLQQIHHATVLHHQQMMNGMMHHHHHHHAYHQGVLPPEQLMGGVPPVPLV